MTFSKGPEKPNRIFRLAQKLPEDGWEQHAPSPGTPGHLALLQHPQEMLGLGLGFPCACHLAVLDSTGEGVSVAQATVTKLPPKRLITLNPRANPKSPKSAKKKPRCIPLHQCPLISLHNPSKNNTVYLCVCGLGS